MPNLKQDLRNNLGNDKYYEELELARLSAEPNTHYGNKVVAMGEILKRLASLDLAAQLLEKYFPEPQEGQVPAGEQQVAPQPEQPVAPAPEQPTPAPQPGQSHAE